MRRLGLALVAAALLAAPAHAQPPAAPADPPAGTPLGGGPYKAVMSEEPSLAGHTVYRPADLSKLDGRKLPVVVWGNGACVNAGNSFRNFLTEIASYGYVVVASGPIDPEWPKSMRPPTVGPDGRRVLPPPATKSGQLVDAIDWATSAKNPYLAQTDAGKVAVMGQSCGGVQALEASADRRTTTTVIWNSGIPIGGTNMAGGKPFLTKEDLKALHAPIAYFVGDLSDQAHPNAQDDFDKLTLPVFLGWERGVPHGGTYRQPNGGEFAGVAVAWLNWRLKDDARSKKMFVGDDCGLCVNPRWVVRQKNLK